MKAIGIFLVMIMIFGISNINSQPIHIVGPVNPDTCGYVKYYNGKKTKKLLPLNVVEFYLGQSSINDRRRAFFQWYLPDSLIPDSSTIHWVHLKFEASPFYSNTVFSCFLFSVGLDLTTAGANQLWQRTDVFNNNWDYFIGYGKGHQLSNSKIILVDSVYNSGTDVVNSLEKALLDDYFTLGIVEHFEYLYKYPYQSMGSSVELEIAFTPPQKSVNVDQVVIINNNEVSVDSIAHYEGDIFVNYRVPHTFANFYVLDTEVFRATQKVLDSVKFNHWYGYDDVLNHRAFKIYQDTENIKALLQRTVKNVVLKNSYISNPAYDGGNIAFKDPWLIDYPDPDYGNNKRNQGMDAPFKSRPSPFNPDYTTSYGGDVYQGVFLNQGYNQGQWIPPYYSVRAPQQQPIPFHGQDITWYFEGWEGDNVVFQDASQNETAVVFQADGAEARAIYKGHMVTDKLSKLGFTSQRHIAYGHGKWYLTYWDGGHIYVTSSSDGQQWGQEVRVSGQLDNCSRPSIAPGLQSGYVYVVWQRYLGNYDYEVYVSRSTNSGQSWSSPVKLATVTITEAQRYGPQPVVAEMRMENLSPSGANTIMAPPPSYTYHTLVAYVCNTGLKWHKSTTQGASWGPQQNIPVENSSYVWFPSMVSGTDWVALAYSYRYGGYEVTSRIYNGYGWGSAANVSGALNLYFDRIPNLGIDRNGNLICAWIGQETVPGNYKVAIRKGNSNNQWSNYDMTTFYPPDGNSAHGVNITFINNTNVDVVFHSDGKRVYRREYVSSLEDYISQSQLSSNGMYGNLPALLQSATVTGLATWLENTGAPYLIKNNAGVQYSSSAAGDYVASTRVRQRVVVFQQVNQNLGGRVGLGNIQVNGTAVRLQDIPRKSVPLSGTTVGEYLRSDAFTVHAGDALSALVIWGVRESVVDSVGGVLHSVVGDISGYVELVSAKDGQVVKRWALEEGDREYRWVAGQDIPAGSYQLRVVLAGKDLSHPDYRWYTYTESSADKFMVAGQEGLMASRSTDQSDDVLPESFVLQPAYPNPFNPSTTLRYGLPEAAKVALEVYSIQGQRIRTVVAGSQSAGWHAVQWDGRGDDGQPVASGVYLVRLTARPSQGAAIVRTQKVILMK